MSNDFKINPNDLHGFSLMGYNDCVFNRGYLWKHAMRFLREACDVAIPPSCVISAIAGFFILLNKKNKVEYPIKFIGMICIV